MTVHFDHGSALGVYLELGSALGSLECIRIIGHDSTLGSWKCTSIMAVHIGSFSAPGSLDMTVHLDRGGEFWSVGVHLDHGSPLGASECPWIIREQGVHLEHQSLLGSCGTWVMGVHLGHGSALVS